GDEVRGRWAADSSRLVGGNEQGIVIWTRDGHSRDVDPLGFDWATPPEELWVLGFTELGGLLLRANDIPGGTKTPDGWFTVDPDIGTLEPAVSAALGSILEQCPALEEFAALYEPGQVRFISTSVDGRSRVYGIAPAGQILD